MHLEFRFKQIPDSGSNPLGQIPGMQGAWQDGKTTDKLKGLGELPRGLLPEPPEIALRYPTRGISTEQRIDNSQGKGNLVASCSSQWYEVWWGGHTVWKVGYTSQVRWAISLLKPLSNPTYNLRAMQLDSELQAYISMNLFLYGSSKSIVLKELPNSYNDTLYIKTHKC